MRIYAAFSALHATLNAALLTALHAALAALDAALDAALAALDAALDAALAALAALDAALDAALAALDATLAALDAALHAALDAALDAALELSPFARSSKTVAHFFIASDTSGWLIPGLTWSSVSNQCRNCQPTRDKSAPGCTADINWTGHFFAQPFGSPSKMQSSKCANI
jgi:hypothetical protein